MRALVLHATCCLLQLLPAAASAACCICCWCCICYCCCCCCVCWCCYVCCCCCYCCCCSSSNFLIYEIEAAVEAAPAIFGRYLVTLWRQLLAAADAFRVEHWVQSRRYSGLSAGELSSPAPMQESRILSSPFRRQLGSLNFQLGNQLQSVLQRAVSNIANYTNNNLISPFLHQWQSRCTFIRQEHHYSYSQTIRCSLYHITDSSELFLDSSELFLDSSELFLDSSELFLDLGELFLDSSEPFLDSSELFWDSSELFLDSSELF